MARSPTRCWRFCAAAWAHVAALVTADRTDKALRPAAIEAAASIRPQEAVEILGPLTDSDDEDIVDAAHEALAMAGAIVEQEEEDVDDDDDDVYSR
jgi:ABC-type sugar transport system substrate-binding protein